MTGSDETSQDSGVPPTPEEAESGASLPTHAPEPAPGPDRPGEPPGAAGAGSTRAWLPWLSAAGAAVLMVVALVVWWQAAHDEALERAQERDTVLITARQQIETLNTLDYRSIDDGLAAWEKATTGKLKDSISEIPAEEKELLADQKKVSTGQVVDAAVTDLDGSSASVIAAIEVTVKDGADASAEPTVKRNRFNATLVKVGDRWLLEDLQQVAVTLQ